MLEIEPAVVLAQVDKLLNGPPLRSDDIPDVRKNRPSSGRIVNPCENFSMLRTQASEPCPLVDS